MGMYRDPRQVRLAKEYELLRELCDNSDLISYEVTRQIPGLSPEEYLIHYRVRTIVSLDQMNTPVYGGYHTAKITLPPGYPMTSAPICYMTTPVWHPNIKSSGHYRGHICINKNVLGAWQTLDMLVEQIGEMLQYKNYHALNEQPYPEDAEVAKWVLTVAEPQGIVSKKHGTDDRPLLRPSPDWASRRRNTIIKITGRRYNPFPESERNEVDMGKSYNPEPLPEIRKSIKIRINR
jgi:ubiquitin-protein ligase